MAELRRQIECEVAVQLNELARINLFNPGDATALNDVIMDYFTSREDEFDEDDDGDGDDDGGFSATEAQEDLTLKMITIEDVREILPQIPLPLQDDDDVQDFVFKCKYKDGHPCSSLFLLEDLELIRCTFLEMSWILPF